MASAPTLRTRVYVDGYNFYYGCLKGTPFKWLDLMALFERHILHSQRVQYQGQSHASSLLPVAIKYFTAKIKEQAAKSLDSVSCQAHYHNALEKRYPDAIERIEGYYAIHPAKAAIVDADDPDKWPRDCEKITIWKQEEKQSDVGLALQMYRDAIRGDVDHIVLATNDTDLEPALRMIRAETNVAIGLVIPTRENVRPGNGGLAAHAHWVRSHITDAELIASQLPRVVQGGKRPTTKPVSWYPNPALLEKALTLAIVVKRSRSEAFKWLEAPNSKFADRAPIDLLSTDAEGQAVIDYMSAYIAARAGADL